MPPNEKARERNAPEQVQKAPARAGACEQPQLPSMVGMPGPLPRALPSLRVGSPAAFRQLARLSAKIARGAT